MSEELITRLRAAALDIRRKPYPISDIIPLLNQAADALSQAGQGEVNSREATYARFLAWAAKQGFTQEDLDGPLHELQGAFEAGAVSNVTAAQPAPAPAPAVPAAMVAPHVYDYGGDVFVAFDPTDGGASIIGAYRTMDEAVAATNKADDAPAAPKPEEKSNE